MNNRKINFKFHRVSLAKIMYGCQKNIRSNLGAIILVGLVAVLAITNYEPGTWLSGWDTIHPEFDFGLYFRRVFFSVWQENQGLGAPASQSHAGELPRLLIYYPLSFILPAQLLRYSYFFLTWLVGVLGVYFFVKKILVKKKGAQREIAALVGGLFYLLNLGTLQHYYLPLEMFAVHFATLPWLFLFAVLFVKGSEKKFLYLFLVVSFFAASMSHTATLFYVYFAGFTIYILSYSLLQRNRRQSKRAFLLLVLTLAVNSFWLLPNLYYVFNHGRDVANSKIHLMFSEKAFLTGKQFGTLSDTAVLRNFYFDWGEYDELRGQFVLLFDEWEPHLAKKYVIGTGYLIFFAVVLGIYFSFRKKNKPLLSLVPVMLFCLIFIVNANIVSEAVFSLITRAFPLIKEVLRFPFTKFSILLIFVYAVFLARTVFVLSRKLGSYAGYLSYLLAGILVVWILLYMEPAFAGNMISPTMRVKIPQEYFEMFSWFKDKGEDERIAHFPVHTFWGWVYYDWGYEGAGFLWFGLRQPLLDREFDRWMPANENYYWEVSRAVYAEDVSLLENVLEKYQVKWILLDKNVISPRSFNEPYYPQLEELFASSDKIRLKKVFGQIGVYEVDLGRKKRGVYLAENLPAVNVYKWGDYDRAYIEFGDYISEVGGSTPKNSYLGSRSTSTQPRGESTGHGFEAESKQSLFRGVFCGVDHYSDRQKEDGNRQSGHGVGERLSNHNTNRILSADAGFSVWGFNTRVSKISNNQSQNSYHKQSERKSEFKSNHDFFPSLVSLQLTNQQTDVPIIPDDITSKSALSRSETSGVKTITAKNTWPALSNILAKRTNSSEEKTGSFGNGLNGDFNAIQDNHTIYYPFRSLFSGRGSQDNEFQVKKRGGGFIFRTRVPAGLQGADLVFPAVDKEEISVRHAEDVSRRKLYIPEVYLDGEKIPLSNKRVRLSYINEGKFEVRIPVTDGFYGYDSNKDKDIQEKFNIFQSPTRAEKMNLAIYLPDLRTNKGYLIGVESRNIKGRPLKFWLENLTAKRDDLQFFLGRHEDMKWEYFIIPPMQEDGAGYTLHFEGEPIGEEKRANELGRVVVQPVPYEFLVRMKVEKEDREENNQETISYFLPHMLEKVRNGRGQVNVEHQNPSLYVVTLNQSIKASNQQSLPSRPAGINSAEGHEANPAGSQDNNKTVKQWDSATLVLSQAYDSGWNAYYLDCQKSTPEPERHAPKQVRYMARARFRASVKCQLSKLLPFAFGERLDNHVLVNNWANGWVLKASNHQNNKSSKQQSIKTSNQQDGQNGSNGAMEQWGNLPADEGGGTIVIVYLPQYLQYLGFLFLAVTPIFLWRYKKA